MSHPSPLPLLVLHGLRLKGFADVSTLAATSGAEPVSIELTLGELHGRGFVHLPGSGSLGWALTRDGRSENERLLHLELELLGARSHVEAAYRRFLGINQELRSLCTDWQVRGDALNDHDDVEYDESVIARLGSLHRRARPVCVELSTRLARFGRYERRLAAALDKVRDGDGGWFTQPLIDSYHTVWFELHEDLLATLGIDRTAEASHL
ncbi:transcriptional regulator [Actinomarinicola tropica]|uniref:Transcriptional regulator n=1 Tax=Actinomarinicola tropica TaxID=2789776 RepID=A0A5Q2RGP7_9ACTN|nr:transcriptional regulator [Actinomarinicola tropica]QGG94903.1 transcriptional regulator [Actinomarinicola tropica]